MGYEGTVVAGRFEIHRFAGRGGMASVYRASDRVTGGGAAVKILGGGVTSHDDGRFAREALLLAELSAPGIVRYLAHGYTERAEPFLAMEWLEGEDLATRLRRAPLNARDAVQLARKVAIALGSAHARGVVHRDIKPGNLFLVDGDVDRVKILDFGIARIQAARELTATGTTIGTPRYMAPEQACGGRDLDARADVFSLGCVLFECLVGQPPFVGDSLMAILAKILLEDVPQLGTMRADLPVALSDLVSRMLSKQPDRRPPDGNAVAAALDGFSDLVTSVAELVLTRHAAMSVDEQRLVCVVFAGDVISGPAWSEGGSLETARTFASQLSNQGAFADRRVGEDGVDLAEPSSTTAASGIIGALSATLTTHGARAEVLADGSVVIIVLGQGAATDHAARAARCAFAVRELLPEAPMALAIGLSVVGSRVTLGELIDRAASLLRSSPVLATGPTQTMPAQRAVRPIRVDEVSAGLLDVRFVIEGGLDGLVLRGERDVSDPVRTLLGRPTTCVGRERELAMLGAIFDECVTEPMAHAVVVTAPAGVGKSRLRHEFLQRIAASSRSDETDVEIWIGRGNPTSAGAPFAILAQALRRAAGIVDGEPRAVRHLKLKARVARHVAESDAQRVTEFLGELVGAPTVEGSSRQLLSARQDPQLMGDQMLRACEDFVAAECLVHPVLLVLEDLHWGDVPTVRFVDAVLRQLPDRPLMVLALARPEVDVVFPNLWRTRGVELLNLGELSRRAAEKLVREALGKDLDEATTRRLVERSAGNAFYLEELIRSVAEGSADRMPATVLAMAQARIEGLEFEARQLLRAASVFGEVFWRGGVTSLLDRSPAHIQQWLDELTRRELVTARHDSRFPGEAEFTFRHALVREAAYAMLAEADRRICHRLAGEWLEARVRADGPSDRAAEVEAVVLAEHFERSGDPRRSIEWYRQAAEQALEGDDLGTSIDRAERAIACASAAPPTDRAMIGALRQLQSSAHVWRGEYELAAARGAEALDRLPPASNRWLAAAAAVADAGCRQLDYRRVVELARVLAHVATPTALHRAYAYAVAMTMPAVLWCGDDPLIELVFARLATIEDHADGGDPSTLAWILNARSWRAMRDGDLAACLTLDTRVAECFVAVGDLRHACQQRGNVGYHEMMLGAYGRAEATLREVIATATRIGIHQVTSQAQHNLGLAVARQGRLVEARDIETAALDAFTAQGNRRLGSAAREYLAVIEIAAGDYRAAISHCRHAIDAAVDHPALASSSYALHSVASRLAGDPQTALELAALAMKLIETNGRPEENDSAIRLAHAEALRAMGEVDKARLAITDAESRLIDAATQIGDPEWRASFLGTVPENARTLALSQAWRTMGADSTRPG